MRTAWLRPFLKIFTLRSMAKASSFFRAYAIAYAQGCKLLPADNAAINNKT
jgi:hypothetical protein